MPVEAPVMRKTGSSGMGRPTFSGLVLYDDSLRDLQSFKRRAHYKAPRGGHGQGALRHGASGEDLVVRVPPGTQVARWDGTSYDLVSPGSRVVIARGGSG